MNYEFENVQKNRPEGIETLPARFRRYIASLEAVAKQQGDALAEGPADSRISLCDGLGTERKIDSGLSARFAFSKPHKSSYIYARFRDAYSMRKTADCEWLNLNASGSLEIVPSASNDVYVRVRPRDD